MKVKVGDNVLVIAGADKGKTGKVTKTLKKENRVIVEGVHVVTRHIKPNRMNETGGILKVEAPIDASNVKVVNETKTAKTTKKTTKKESEK
jgi:large subunit ribosomal protein L24